MLAGKTRILIRAHVVPGPAVEAALLDVRDIVGHQIVPEGIALVYSNPQLAGLRVYRKT